MSLSSLNWWGCRHYQQTFRSIISFTEMPLIAVFKKTTRNASAQEREKTTFVHLIYKTTLSVNNSNLYFVTSSTKSKYFWKLWDFFQNMKIHNQDHTFGEKRGHKICFLKTWGLRKIMYVVSLIIFKFDKISCSKSQNNRGYEVLFAVKYFMTICHHFRKSNTHKSFNLDIVL